MTIFNSVFIKFEEFFRGMDARVWAAIISILLASALFLFWLSIKNSKRKPTLISNSFLFYLAVIILVFALISSIVMAGFR